jgi:hypothetical protein
MLHRVAIDRTHLEKLRQDIDKHINKPYRETIMHQGKHGECFSGMTYDRIFEMEYFC